MSLRRLNYEIDRQLSKLRSLQKENDYNQNQLNKVRQKLDDAVLNLEKIREAADEYRSSLEREVRRETKQLQQQLKELKERGFSKETTKEDLNKKDIARASTLAFFDSLIFAIGNWSNDGQAAPDCELACQSVLFPAVYEKVMQSNEDYYIPEVPSVALEIVRRGRQYIKHIRSICNTSLIEQDAWEEFAPLIQEWWINDALPLLYGARDPAWEETPALTRLDMIEWRDMPASRALHFPLIFDGMELVKTHGDEIREFTGLPEFNKLQVTTRIDP